VTVQGEWRPESDPAFVVTVRDVEWFRTWVAKAVHRGRVSAVYAVDDDERRGLRPDVMLSEKPSGW
jgi:hypothetical protein